MFVATFLLTALVLGAVLFLASQLLSVQAETSQELLEHWSRMQGLRVVRAERRWLDTGPFPVTGALEAPTFRVVARTRQCDERTAWVRCGSCPLGVILHPVVEARWS